MAETGTNLISSINKSGSGVDLSNLVGALVSAETSHLQDKLTKNVDATNLQISTYGQLSTKLKELDTSLTTLENTDARFSVSSDSKVAVLTVTNETLAQDLNSNITITSLAAGQVVTYDLTHSSLLNSSSLSSSSSINTGSIDFTMNGQTTTITIDSSNNTVQGLVNEINKISGAQATIIDTSGSGALSLVLKSDPGTANAFSLSSTDNLSMFNTSGMSSSSSPVKLSVSASDAVFEVDGLAITRSTNSITDVFSGYTLDLNKISSDAINVTSAVVASNARDRMLGFINSVNSMRNYLALETKRGFNGAEDGSLVGDVGAQIILSELQNLTTDPIKGFADTDYYLANLGVFTERDGTLSLDNTRFDNAIANNPDLLNIVFASKYSTSSDKLSVTGLSSYPPTPGSYSFSFTQTNGTGVLNSESLSSVNNASGNKVFTGTTGSTENMSVEVLNDAADVTGTVRFGKSLIDSLQSYITDITSSSGVIKNRTSELTLQLSDYREQQVDLDSRIESLTAAYNEKFGAMESLVTQLNKTGEYLTSMMDAWNKKD